MKIKKTIIIFSVFTLFSVVSFASWYSPSVDVGNSDLVAYYKFDNDTKDYSGQGNDGTENGYTFNHGLISGATHTTGKYGQGYEFDNVDDFIAVDSSITVNSTCFWSKVRDDGDQSYFLVSNPISETIGKRIGGQVAIYEGGGWANFNHVVTDNTWEYYCFVWNLTHTNLYVDAVYDSSVVKAPITFDRFGDSDNDSINGTIDEVRIWNVALTSAEITSEMNSRQPVRADGLVASYSFESKNSTHTFDTNNIIQSRIGGGGYFDGSDDYIVIDDSPELSFTNSFSISSWVKFDRLDGGGSEAIVRKGSAGGADVTWMLYWIDSSNRIAFYTGSGESKADWTPVNGRWYHLVSVTNSTGHTAFYVNSVLLNNAGTEASTFVDDTDPINIGDWSIYEFNGTIDEVRIYNVSLSADEVVQLYSCQAPQFGIWDVITTCNIQQENVYESDVDLVIRSNGELALTDTNVTVDSIIIEDGSKLIKDNDSMYSVV